MREAKAKAKLKIKLFGKWDFDGVEIQDLGLKQYISLKPMYIPHSGGRHEHQKFGKSTVNIVERLVNNMMRYGACGGKKAKAIGIVKNAFEIAYLKTKKNPIQVLVEAIENSAPNEDVTRISYGGIVYHMAVDISPQRRVDLALRFLTEGARKGAIGNLKTIDESLADELILASEGRSESYAVKKKDEMERIALSSR